MRERLLDAATELCTERGLSVSTRAIARRARVTPAMIAYYFRDKRGLFEAMFERVFARILGRVRELAAHPEPGGDPIESFVRLYIGTFAADPWIPQLIVREVLYGESRLRQRFIERFALPIGAVVPSLFSREIEAGRLRRELDPVLTVISLVGMCAFPFIAQPVMGPVLGFQIDDEFRDRLIAHVTRVFLDGARPGEAP